MRNLISYFPLIISKKELIDSYRYTKKYILLQQN